MSGTPDEVATWLLAELNERLKVKRSVYQYEIVKELQATWGDEWVYRNENGNLAIDRTVLQKFRALPGWSVGFKWVAGAQAWDRTAN